VWHFAALVYLLWLLPSAYVARAQTKVSIIHIVTGLSGVPLWIAHEQGLFAKQGIDAQLLSMRRVACLPGSRATFRSAYLESPQ
jgi:ABC-type nitrate/sulfonate/bicarbonate transport system substrate-binding protein